MSAVAVLVNAAMVAFEVFLAIAYGSPLIAACLVFTVLMFLWTLFMWAES